MEICNDCKSENIVWFTDNVFWDIIMKGDKSKILCPQCFVIRAEKVYKPTGWRLIPEFKWETIN